MMLNNKVMAMLKALSGGNSGGSGAPSDWNASEGEPGHVLNRTHYEEGSLTDTLTFDGNPEGKEIIDMGTGFLLLKLSDTGVESSELIGGMVTALYDNGEIEQVAISERSITDMAQFIGSPAYSVSPALYVILEDATGNGMTLPKGIYNMYAPDEFYAIEVKAPSAVFGEVTIKTLDPKFLPSSLQFGETVVGGDTLTWDGNTDGLVNVSGYFFKISDITPTLEDVNKGGTCACILVDGTIFVEGQFEVTSPFDGIIMCDLDGMAIIIVHENAVGIDLDGIAFPEAGIYCIKSEGFSVRITINGYNGFPCTVVSTLDSKFLPEHSHSWNSLSNKPFGDTAFVVDYDPDGKTLYGTMHHVKFYNYLAVAELYALCKAGKATIEVVIEADGEVTTKTAKMEPLGHYFYGIDGEVMFTQYSDFMNGEEYFSGFYFIQSDKKKVKQVSWIVRDYLDSDFIMLTSPNGIKYKLSVADDGTLSAISM